METTAHCVHSRKLRSRIVDLLAGLRGNTRGNTFAVFAFAAIPLMGCVGMGLDMAQWVLWKRQLHSAADLAALAGASANADGNNVTAAVNRALALNDLRDFKVVAIENAPLGGSYAGDNTAVRVALETQESLPFSSMFLNVAPIISVSATAIGANQSPNCVISLDTAGTGVSITGSSSVTMNCALASNSDFDATSSDLIDVAALSAVGSVSEGGAVSMDTKVNNGIAPVADPYAGSLPIPDGNTSCSPNSWPLIKTNTVVSPACYSGLQIQGGTTTLLPGTYIIGDKGISVAGGASLVGNNVTLIFTSTEASFNDKKVGTFSAAGTSTIQLSAPTSGTYAGVLMYQDPRTPTKSTTSLKITGDSSSSFQGSIYAPSVDVTFTGNSGMATDCLQIVALYVSFGGNTSIANNCPSGSGASSFGGSAVLRLVE